MSSFTRWEKNARRTMKITSETVKKNNQKKKKIPSDKDRQSEFLAKLEQQKLRIKEQSNLAFTSQEANLCSCSTLQVSSSLAFHFRLPTAKDSSFNKKKKRKMHHIFIIILENQKEICYMKYLLIFSLYILFFFIYIHVFIFSGLCLYSSTHYLQQNQIKQIMF